MYGDCQVMSSAIGGNAIPSDDSLYTSPSIQNPNFNFNPFDIFNPIKEETAMAKSKEEMESGSGSDHNEGGGMTSANDQEMGDQPPPAKKKRYHRHTARQIQEMEALFKECPHPDDKQRLRLSQELDLKPRQVKFWFQNRRTQMKAQQDRQDNAVLRAENDNLKKENYRLQGALRNVVCPNCGGPAILGEMGFDEHNLRIENARLKEELDRVCCLLAQYNGRPMQELSPSQLLDSSLELDMGNVYPRKFDENLMNPFMGEGSTQCLIMEEEKSLAVQLAVSSADELVKMSQMGEPLWIQTDFGRWQVLNVEEYNRVFTNGLSDAAQFRTEGTRDSAVVIMNSISLVEAFMDANKWMELFPSIISRAKTLQVVHPGVSGQAIGCLLLMYAEIQVLSPLVSTREFHFLRYCQHNADQGSWTIVDFPIDGFHNFCPPPLPYCRRHPSGCVIQDMPNGYSSLTWIEHSEVENAPIHHVFDHLVTSGTAFGACSWLAALQSQCERLASVMARNISDLGVIPSPEARTNLMNLAQRMVRTFCLNVSTCYGQSWTALSDSVDDTVRITTRKVAETDLGQPSGLILSAVSTTWLPYEHKQVFDFLRDERRRLQLEVLSNGNSLHEVAHIANGSHPGNCISLLRINVASNSSQTVELVLQESCSDDSGSIVVYSTINVDALQLAMNGQDPSSIPLLPLGFVLVPVQQPTTGDTGCLLTVGLQVLVSTMATAKINLSSITAINHHLCTTVEQINAALGNNDNSDEKGDDDHHNGDN